MEATRTVSLQPDRMIAHYRLVSKLGEGGMGVVWRARDTRLDRDVALKTLPPDLVGDPSRRERFIREAKAAAAVSHPNIAAIHDVGEADGVVYLAMELVEGRTLRRLAGDGRLPIPRALRIAAQIADGLGRAHREGIVHRDIKPDNVIVGESGHAKILDFGLARLRGVKEKEQADLAERETVAALTDEGQTVGTVPYMSPEQARGKPTDGRSDLFSLGIVLYELVTGRLPFRGETKMDVMSAILNESPDSPSSLNPAVGERLAELLDKCLQKDPARRYQSAGDLAIDLRRLYEAMPPASASTATAQASPKSRALPRAAGVVIVLAAFGLAAAWWLGRRGGELEARPDQPDGTVDGQAPARIRSLAVLPLDDHSPGHDEQYFADGMTEALIAELTQISDLRVISRTSVMQYRDRRPPLPKIAEELGVDAVVEGSVLRADGRIRIIAQLIEGADDRHLWAGTYEREHKNVLALQRDVAIAIAGEIGGALRPNAARDPVATHDVVPEAHLLLLRGEENLTIGTEESLRRSFVQFRSALKIDPGYARAWLGISRAYLGLANAYVAPRKAMPEAKKAALRALSIDPRLADAYLALSGIQQLFEWNKQAARSSRKRARELDPDLLGAILGEAFERVGRDDLNGAFELAEKARRLDPLSPQGDKQVFWVHLAAQDFEGALAVADDLTERFPSDAFGHFQRGMALEILNRHEEALTEAQKAVDLDEAIWSLAALARAQALAGKEAEARATLARMESTPSDRYQCPYETALSWTALGEYGRARPLFTQGIEERAACWAFADVDGRVDPVRKLPWFQGLLARRTPMGPDDPDYVPVPPELGLDASP